MKKTITLLCILFPLLLFSQSSKNISLLSFVPISENMNDVWGYVAPDKTEYALAGSTEGTYVFDLSDPTKPEQVAFVAGPNSTWRDIKVWGSYAYVTNETSDGLLIMDLTQLPDTVITKRWTGAPGSVTFSSAHNIFIDEKGYAYIVGADYGRGGAIIVDLTQNPWSPTVATVYNEGYIHDLFVRGDTMWAGEIYNGYFSVVDVSDKSQATIPPSAIMATQPTPNSFTHNIWVSDDNRTAVTTDEVSNGKVAAYDVSDLNNIEAKDRYRSNPGSNVIPHNAYFDGDFVAISYYRDGLRIIDASKTDNLVEVGHYDSSPNLSGNGFNGDWGVYPYLPSGTYLVTDIERGLFILKPTLIHAAYLEGTVTDTTGVPLDMVDIDLSGPTVKSAATDVFGEYSTGVADPGSYTVTFRKPGYKTKEITNEVLASGQTNFLDVELIELPSYSISGKVIDKDSQMPIPFAQVKATDGFTTFFTQADANGNYTFNSVYQDTFRFYAGKWSYRVNKEQKTYVANAGISPVIELSKGYEDDFYFDLGWTVSGDAATGIWERGNPIGTESQGFIFNPAEDVQGDFGNQCYVTGNGGGNPGDDDVDNGTTILESPYINVSAMATPVIHFSKWFVNGGGAGSPNDTLFAQIVNASDTVTIDVTGAAGSTIEWTAVSLALDSFWNKMDSFKMRFVTSDLSSSGHLVEAGIDQFEIIDGSGIAPTAGFYLNDVRGCAPFTFTPTDTSAGEPDQWKWIVSGPVVDSFMGQQPQITLSTPGVYDITLVTTNAFGENELQVLAAVEVDESPEVSTTSTPASPGQNNGSVSANVTGGTPPYTYVWTDPSGQTIQDTNNLAAGIYEVVVTDANGCTDSKTVEVQTATGINEPADFGLSVYPNPFDIGLNINFSAPVNVESVTMKNITGQEIAVDWNKTEGTVSVSTSLATGVYILQIRLQNGTLITRKLTKN